MPGLSPEVQARMKDKARSVASQMNRGGGGGRKRLSLTGRDAVVPPGGAFVGRCLPRWDIALKWMKDAQGQWVTNPQYQDDVIYFVALEHWWDDADGKPHREWCPKTFDENAPCPLCEQSALLKAARDQEDKDTGFRIAAKEVFLFNFILSEKGRRALNESGKPDIKVLPAPNTIFVGISSFMTGGAGDEEDAQQFARGDISDPREGFDVKITRSTGQGGDRHKVECAPAPSPLYTQADAATWAGWQTLLIPLDKLVSEEMKSYDELYALYHGSSPVSPEPAGDFVPDDPSAAPPPPEVVRGEGWARGVGTTPPTTSAPPDDPWGASFDPPSTPPAAPPRPAAPPTPRSAPRTPPPPRRPSGRR